MEELHDPVEAFIKNKFTELGLPEVPAKECPGVYCPETRSSFLVCTKRVGVFQKRIMN